MRYTGYVLLAIAGFLVLYVILNSLVFDVGAHDGPIGPEAGAGQVNADPGHRGMYWLALGPAAVSAFIGLRMVLGRHKGYKETYDMRQQQS